MLEFLEFLGETLDLSELLWKPVVFLYLVGLVVCYGLWGGIGILVIEIGRASCRERV